ncbi:MAG: M14 family metallopeptidase [Gemmatimonadetes bacterium]|nr:M14 family metallopeptidase [Gemmatimonadota bacterium]
MSPLCSLLVMVALTAPLGAQTRVTSPEAFFGYPIGADYVLPDYRQFVSYWEKLDGESDRMRITSIGETAEGRPQLMAIITSPANQRNLDRFRGIARRLALADGVSESEARALAREGRAVVWIDGGLHASEVLGPQQLLETVWQLVSRDDEETLRILDEVIILAVHANPDGHDLVANWYMREPDPLQRSTENVPRLYQKYVGHDNNRDSYASTQNETTNMNRVLYHEWFPQILYNHHQTGPAGSVMFAPPFRDPFNYVFHPLIVTGLDLLGAAMHSRFIAGNMPGVTMREGAGYSTWWNGGLRTTAYFHNILGLLTETKGNPTPTEIPLIPALQQASGRMPYPIEPQVWRFRQSIDYSVTANYAVLDIASRYREQFLFNIWKMGSDAIAKGSTDSWTDYPKRVAQVLDAMKTLQPDGATGLPEACGRVREGMPAELQRPCMGVEAGRRFMAMLRSPGLRDPRGYIIPSDQPDFATATRFIHALQKNGVTVQRATTTFGVGDRSYPAGSFVVRTAQAFRPHILDMFEPQDHPNDFEFAGGPPIHPYDAAGWTLAFQMGVRFDRVLDEFAGPFETIQGLAPMPRASIVAGSGRVAGYLLSPAQNDAFRAASRLLRAGARVTRITSPWNSDGATASAGAFWIAAEGAAAREIERLAAGFGVRARAMPIAPPDSLLHPLTQPRVGLWDRYGGSMPSGWTRWLMEQFEMPFSVVFPQRMDAGDLRRDFDVLVFFEDAIPAEERSGPTRPDSTRVPRELWPTLGEVTVARTVPQLRAFLEAGGTIVAIGPSSVALATHLGLPVRNHLVELDEDSVEVELTGDRYFIPTSIIEAAIDRDHPIAWGMRDAADLVFDESPVFTFHDSAGIEPIAWYDRDEPLRSGWAWGQQFLRGGLAAARVKIGRGQLVMFGPEILYRAQPHGSFKLFFNALYGGASVTAPPARQAGM